MNKKTRAALAGLAFFAGCEIGIAIQLMKMIHKFTVRESAMAESVPEDAAETAEAPSAEKPSAETPEEPENETAQAVSEEPEMNE